MCYMLEDTGTFKTKCEWREKQSSILAASSQTFVSWLICHNKSGITAARIVRTGRQLSGLLILTNHVKGGYWRVILSTAAPLWNLNKTEWLKLFMAHASQVPSTNKACVLVSQIWMRQNRLTQLDHPWNNRQLSVLITLQPLHCTRQICAMRTSHLSSPSIKTSIFHQDREVHWGQNLVHWNTSNDISYVYCKW